MAAARDALRPTITAVAAAILLLLIHGCGGDPMSGVPSHGRGRAEALVAAYAEQVGAPGGRLSADNKASFGPVSFRYFNDSDALSVRVYVNAALLEDAPPEELENYRRIVTYLNDPEVGGMYERGGGYFILDESSEAYYLVKDVPVSQLDPAGLRRLTERLQNVAARWTTGWLGEVAMIMHGHRPKPTKFAELPSD